MGPHALAKELNMSAMDAFEMQQSFFREFSGVTNWREVCGQRLTCCARCPQPTF
jgi:hypothetical protein